MWPTHRPCYIRACVEIVNIWHCVQCRWYRLIKTESEINITSSSSTVNKISKQQRVIIDRILCPQCAAHYQYFRSSLFSKIWLKSRLLCLSCSIASNEYTQHATGHQMKTWRHPQNWKYMTYRNAVRGGLSHGHRCHTQKINWSSAMWFSSHESRQTDKHVKKHTKKGCSNEPHESLSHRSTMAANLVSSGNYTGLQKTSSSGHYSRVFSGKYRNLGLVGVVRLHLTGPCCFADCITHQYTPTHSGIN